MPLLTAVSASVPLTVDNFWTTYQAYEVMMCVL